MHDAGHADHPSWSRTPAFRRGVGSDCWKQKRELAAMPRSPHLPAGEEAKAARSPLPQHSAERLGLLRQAAVANQPPSSHHRRLWRSRNQQCAGGSECEIRIATLGSCEQTSTCSPRASSTSRTVRVHGGFLLGHCGRGVTNASELRIPVAPAPVFDRLHRFTPRFEGPCSRQQGVRATAASHQSR